eukprot:947982-Rhodomonas_salina.1
MIILGFAHSPSRMSRPVSVSNLAPTPPGPGPAALDDGDEHQCATTKVVAVELQVGISKSPSGGSQGS